MDNVDKLCVFVGILLIVSIVAYPLALYGSEQQHEITIDEKWTKQHDDDMKYLVSDTDGNVYSIEDCIWLLKWDASSRYANIDEGKTYDVTLIGWRVPILSWYQNIVEIEVK